MTPVAPVPTTSTTTGTSIEKLDCLEERWDEFALDTCYDKVANEIVFKAVVPDNSWFSIGFGTTMSDTDMIAWFVTNGVGSARDYWSTFYSAPALDTVSNLTEDRAPTFASGKMTFVTRRALDTGDDS